MSAISFTTEREAQRFINEESKGLQYELTGKTYDEDGAWYTVDVVRAYDLANQTDGYWQDMREPFQTDLFNSLFFDACSLRWRVMVDFGCQYKVVYVMAPCAELARIGAALLCNRRTSDAFDVTKAFDQDGDVDYVA